MKMIYRDPSLNLLSLLICAFERQEVRWCARLVISQTACMMYDLGRVSNSPKTPFFNTASFFSNGVKRV